jgi:hypothetical protein
MPRTDQAVTGIALHPSGTMRPMYKPRGNGIRDIREVSGEFSCPYKTFGASAATRSCTALRTTTPSYFLQA